MNVLQQPTVPMTVPEPLRSFLSVLLRQLVDAIQAIQRGPAGGVLSEQVALVSGANVVAHKLGRKPAGYVVGRCSAAMTVHSTSANWDARTAQLVTVNASAAGSCSLWFY